MTKGSHLYNSHIFTTASPRLNSVDERYTRMNLRVGKYLFQIVWWGWRWNVGYWRWPPLETRLRGEAVTPGLWMNFGFHGVYIGPVEFRFHPNHASGQETQLK